MEIEEALRLAEQVGHDPDRGVRHRRIAGRDRRVRMSARAAAAPAVLFCVTLFCVTLLDSRDQGCVCDGVAGSIARRGQPSPNPGLLDRTVRGPVVKQDRHCARASEAPCQHPRIGRDPGTRLIAQHPRLDTDLNRRVAAQRFDAADVSGVV